MAIDPSIFQSVQPPQINIPSPLDMAQKAMALSTAGMQQMQMARQLRTQSAMQEALAKNTDASGSLDADGAAQYLTQNGMAQAGMQLKGEIFQQQKAQAESQSANADAQQKMLDIAHPAMGYLLDMKDANGNPDDQAAAAAYHGVVNQLAGQKVDVSRFPADWDRAKIQQGFDIGSQAKQQLANQSTIAATNKTNLEAGAIPSQVAKNQAETQKATADAAKTRSETITRQPVTPGQVNDPTTDPATLVPGQVLMQHQAKAFDEIKNAQDIKNLSPQIMAAFQSGSSRNPNTAAQGQREFEGLINTTVKETEGTARQAAFDSIHRTMTPSGPTAFPGEDDAKARTVQEYLASKAAAPTALAYGINLKNYNSTSPYQLPQKSAASPGSSANAATRAQAPAGPSASDKAALNYLKTADPSTPEAFAIRAKLKKRGLL